MAAQVPLPVMAGDFYRDFPCDVCGETDAAEVPHCQELVSDGTIHICRRCGLVYAKRRRTAARIAEVWSTDSSGVRTPRPFQPSRLGSPMWPSFLPLRSARWANRCARSARERDTDSSSCATAASGRRSSGSSLRLPTAIA